MELPACQTRTSQQRQQLKEEYIYCLIFRCAMLLAIPSTIFRTEVTFWGLAGPALWGLCEGTARWSTSAESRWFGVPQQHQGQVTGESCPIRTRIYGGALLSKEHQPDPTWHQGSPSLQCQSISINININQMNVGGSNWRWWDWWNHVESSWLPQLPSCPRLAMCSWGSQGRYYWLLLPSIAIGLLHHLVIKCGNGQFLIYSYRLFFHLNTFQSLISMPLYLRLFGNFPSHVWLQKGGTTGCVGRVALYGVFDGHGPAGHRCAALARGCAILCSCEVQIWQTSNEIHEFSGFVLHT